MAAEAAEAEEAEAEEAEAAEAAEAEAEAEEAEAEAEEAEEVPAELEVAAEEAVRLDRVRGQASRASSPSCRPRQRRGCFSPEQRREGETLCPRTPRDTRWRAGEEASRTNARACRSAATRTGSSWASPTNALA